MMLSGWRIYDASPIFKSFMFPPSLTLGGWLGGALAMALRRDVAAGVQGLLYLALNLASGPLCPQVSAAVAARNLRRFRRGADGQALARRPAATTNAVQKFAYLFVICDLIVLVLSGLAIWKSVQFPLLRELMGGYDTARIVHFVAMSLMAAFIVVHVVDGPRSLPRSLLAMLRGR